MNLLRGLAALMLLAACVPMQAQASEAPAAYFKADPFPDDQLETAWRNAAEMGRLAIVVFGADWCHDSRALARTLTGDAFLREFGARYTVTFIDVGKPQTGEGRNLDLVESLGVKKLKSTPAMFVLNGIGKPLNSKADALSWRNADSRGEAKTLAWFRQFERSAK